MRCREAERIASRINFRKGDGLVPAIAQSAGGEVLMLAFMNRDALLKTLTSGRMWYYSRSRKKLWEKGESSGNAQRWESFSVDCDADSLLFRVAQRGNACHTGNRTCFYTEYGKQTSLSLDELYSLVLDRKKNMRENSYTCKLLRDERKLLGKIDEESAELVRAVGEGRRQVIWESCDVLYHMLVLLAKENVSMEEIYRELGRRNKKRSR